jgi:hypothetical protein
LVPAPVFEVTSIETSAKSSLQPYYSTGSTTSSAAKPRSAQEMLTMERENRDELEHDDALVLLERIKSKL